MSSIVDPVKKDLYERLFQACDEYGRHLITIDQLDSLLKTTRYSKYLPSKMVRYVHRLAQNRGDSTVNFEQFVDILEHPDWQHRLGDWVDRYVNLLVPKPKRTVEVETTQVEYIARDIASFTPRGRSALSSRRAKVSVRYEPKEIEYADEYSCCPPPVAMFFISLLELGCFLADELNQKDSTLSGTGVTAKIFLYDPTVRWQCWRYLTYCLVHIGNLHLGVNLTFQLALGIPLEMVHKWWRVVLVYTLGVIAGSLTTSVADPRVRLAGASGGVYALMTAHIASIIMNWSEMTFPAVQLSIFLIVATTDLGSAIYDRYYLNVESQVAFLAHVGGAAAGLLVGIYTLRNLNVKKAEKHVWWFALVLYIVLTAAAILVNVFCTGLYPS